MFSDISPAERVPQAHPVRTMRVLVDAVLKERSPPCDRGYSPTGRPSMAPEQLLRPVRYTIRRERLLMEPLEYNLRCRWCVGLHMDELVWDPSTVSKHRERLRAGDMAQAFVAPVWAHAREQDWLSDEPVTVDGTLLEAWAGQKRCTRKTSDTPAPPPNDPGNPSIDVRGERRPHAPHASTTDPEARLYKKAPGQEATLA